MRRLILTTHLYLGVTAGLVLVVIGLTGSIIAFEADIPRWLHRDLFYVAPAPHALPEETLVRTVEARFAPARVTAVQMPRGANLAHVVRLPGGLSVFVNPYTGAILGSMQGPFRSARLLGYVHQIHLRLVPVPSAAPRLAASGKFVISAAGALLCFLVPTGLILFWRTRRIRVKWTASWSRIGFDLHHVLGVCLAPLLFASAVTGVLIGFSFGESAIFALTGSARQTPPPAPHSAAPSPDGRSVSIDRALDIARRTLPEATIAGYTLPRQPTDTFVVSMRVPEETSEVVHSSVAVDRYSGQVLQVRDFRIDSPGFFWVRFNRSLHTGDIFGTPSHILTALTSLLLVVMVATGIGIWWRKLAV